LAEQADPAKEGPDQRLWFERLERELDNLRTAMRWSIDARDADACLRLAGALGMFWLIRGYRSGGQRWLKEALVAGATGNAAARAKALGYASFIADGQGEFD
jgi:predicted ATPase